MPIVMPPPGDPDGYIFERAAMERLRHFKTLVFERDDDRPPLDPAANPWLRQARPGAVIFWGD
jgi:hypothetical protein